MEPFSPWPGDGPNGPRNTNADFVVRLFNGPLDSVPWRNGRLDRWVQDLRNHQEEWNKQCFFNGFFHWNLGDLIFFQSLNGFLMDLKE